LAVLAPDRRLGPFRVPVAGSLLRPPRSGHTTCIKSVMQLVGRWSLPSDPAGWFSAGGGLTYCINVGQGPDQASSCRPSPSEDHRRDWIGVWRLPELSCVRRRSASCDSSMKGRCEWS
jgi:hypothetical protein